MWNRQPNDRHQCLYKDYITDLEESIKASKLIPVRSGHGVHYGWSTEKDCLHEWQKHKLSVKIGQRITLTVHAGLFKYQPL